MVWNIGNEETSNIITDWTINAGNFTFPALETEGHTGTIDWGDGLRSDYNSTESLVHNYKSNGTYTICVYCDIVQIKESAFESRTDLIYFSCKTATVYNEKCFYSCKNLKTVEISDNTTIIGKMSFYLCSALKNFKLPEKIQEIRYGAFWGSGISGDITIKSEILYSCAFALCYNIANVKISDNVSQLKQDETVSFYSNSYQFVNCTGIESITIGETYSKLENIPSNFFSGRKSDSSPYANMLKLKKVVIAEGVKSLGTENTDSPVFHIGANKVEECEAWIPSSITEMYYTFSLESSNSEHPTHTLTIHYNGNNEQWKNITKGERIYGWIGLVAGTVFLETTDGKFYLNKDGGIGEETNS